MFRQFMPSLQVYAQQFTDVHSHQPACVWLRAHHCNFIMVCLPESHLFLYEQAVIFFLFWLACCMTAQIIRRPRRCGRRGWHSVPGTGR